MTNLSITQIREILQNISSDDNITDKEDILVAIDQQLHLYEAELHGLPKADVDPFGETPVPVINPFEDADKYAKYFGVDITDDFYDQYDGEGGLGGYS